MDLVSTIHKRILGIFTCSLVVLSGLFGAVFCYGPFLPLIFLWPKLYRRTMEFIASVWHPVIVAINEKVFGIKMVYTGNSVKTNKKVLFILNHRTRYDWYFFFSFVFHSNILSRHKISLKAILKWFPGIGWAMQADSYIFLDRNWEKDKSHIERILKYQIDLNSVPNILLFPEGTDLTEETKAKSQKFAKKNNLPQFEYVLQPRVTGFCFFVKTLRKIEGIDSIYDVTIGYPYNIAQGEKELVKGDVPKEVHFHLKKYSINEIPEDEKELVKWIHRVWKEKEERLKKFYCEPIPSKRSFSEQTIPNLKPRALEQWISLVLWTFSLPLMIYILSFKTGRYYFLIVSTFYLLCGFLFGGVDKLEINVYEFFKPYNLWNKNHKKIT